MPKRLEQLPPWYQTIYLEEDLTTHGRAECGDPMWQKMKRILPKTFKGMRVLDLGSNAGIFCVRASLLGANEAIGIEKSDHFYHQALFIKDYFEKKCNRKLNIKYIRKDMNDAVDKFTGRFDIIFAISSLYYLKKGEEEFVDKLNGLTDWVICGYREGQKESEFTRFFLRQGFGVQMMLPVCSKTGRFLVSYVREK